MDPGEFMEQIGAGSLAESIVLPNTAMMMRSVRPSTASYTEASSISQGANT